LFRFECQKEIHMVIRKSTRFGLSTLALLLAGCGSSSDALDLKMVPVAGTVTFAGQMKPGIRVLFVPKGSTPGSGAFGVTDEEGQYELQQQEQTPGVPPGQYSVHFSCYVKPDGSPVPPDVSPTESNAVQAVPLAWSDPALAGPHNTVTVPETGQSFSFTIPQQ
jgi:hypothetical protein